MKHPRVRVVLAVVVALASIAAGYHVFRTARQVARLQASARQFDDSALALIAEAADLQAGQRAYVAPGQGLAFWTQYVGRALTVIQADLGTLRNAATAPDAQTAVESAQAAARQLSDMDARIRKGLRIGDALGAADTIFSDGEQGMANLVLGVEQARTRQLAETAAGIGALERREAILAGSAALLLLLAMIALVPVRPAQTAEEPPLVLMPSTEPEAEARATAGPEFGELRLTADPAAATPAGADVDFEAAATLCAEIARLESPVGLPMVLERAAAVLDASGVVLWAVAGNGTALTAALTHGYPPEVAARMPTIPCDANNVTAAAFRTGRLQYATGDMVTRGALAAPLVSPAGTVGVFTAEMRNSGELQPVRRALASIVASQLSTIISSVPPARS